MIIDGKKIANDIIARLASRSASERPEKFLAAIQVGDDPATASFIALKAKVAKQLGVDFRVYTFPATVTSDELRAEFGKVAGHKTCGGVMVELPMPESLNWHYILNAIPPEKDVDVLSERALGAFYVGRGRGGVTPPAVGALEEVLKNVNVYDGFDSSKALANKTVAIVGLGLLVGRPVAHWLMRRAKETILLRSTSDLGLLARADIIITGVGKAGVIKQEMLKPEAIVIDFGYDDGKGDFEGIGADLAKNDKISYTPTPGGTGPILVAKLFENFYTLASEEDK